MQRTNARARRPRLAAAAAGLLCGFFALAAGVPGVSGEPGESPYLGQKPPGATPLVFAPGVVSTAAHEFSCSFTPDGKEFYFTRRENLQSPTVIMVSKWAEGGWTPPAPAPFNDTGDGGAGGMSFEPMVTPDGRRLYFSSDRPLPGQPAAAGMPMLNIWYVEREGTGWSAAKNPGPPFNPMKTMFVSATKTGTIYTTDISGGMASQRIAVLPLEDGAYRSLVDLGEPVNAGPINHYPFIASDESFVIFTRRSAPGAPGGLFISRRSAAGKWGEPRPVDLGPLPAGQGIVSPDGRYFFFTAGERLKGDIYWVEASVLGQ